MKATFYFLKFLFAGKSSKLKKWRALRRICMKSLNETESA